MAVLYSYINGSVISVLFIYYFIIVFILLFTYFSIYHSIYTLDLFYNSIYIYFIVSVYRPLFWHYKIKLIKIMLKFSWVFACLFMFSSNSC